MPQRKANMFVQHSSTTVSDVHICLRLRNHGVVITNLWTAFGAIRCVCVGNGPRYVRTQGSRIDLHCNRTCMFAHVLLSRQIT